MFLPLFLLLALRMDSWVSSRPGQVGIEINKGKTMVAIFLEHAKIVVAQLIQ